MENWKKINSKIKYRNPWWEYKLDNFMMPNGKNGEYHYVHTLGSTFVIPILDDGNFVLTKQYRYLNSKFSIEFPGGGQQQGITPEKNAKKELQEETGYICNKLEKIGVFNPYNGVTDEISSVFIAKNLLLDKQNLDETEDIEVLIASELEIDEMIKNQEIWDGMTLASWALFKLKG